MDPNSHFDPTQKLVLNPNAWTDAPFGQFGTSAAYYNDFRWQRQPVSISLHCPSGTFARSSCSPLQIRAEFQNIFNRLFYSLPGDGGAFGFLTNPATPTGNTNPGGTLSSGFGYVNWLNGAGAQPRTGQIIVRFQFWVLQAGKAARAPGPPPVFGPSTIGVL